MRNSMKKMLAIGLVASIAAVTFGCSDNKNPIKETISLEDTKQELQFFYNTGDSQDSTEAENQETTAQTAEPATEIASEVVEVTDPSGQPVTEADGSVQTEVHTEVVTLPVETTPAPEYTPSYDTCKAYWLDMSNAGDFVFDGELFVFSFKIKETAPDGKYPVTIAKTDIGSWDVVTRVPECIGGEVCVGNEKPSEQKDAPADKFSLTVESVNGKPGDVVEVALNMKNNPGFCGFVIDIQYDKNAMEIEEARGGADFDKAVNFIS